MILLGVWYNYNGNNLSKQGGVRMNYNYNKLWKLLIDRKITKTEMRLKSGISTNMLAKMGKDEPVSMETLAKIATYLECGIDDICEFKATERI